MRLLLTGDGSVNRYRSEVGAHCALHEAEPGERTKCSELSAYWSEGWVTPTMGELLWIALGLDQVRAYLDAMVGEHGNWQSRGEEQLQVDIYCDNALAANCVLEGGATAVGFAGPHLVPLADVCLSRRMALHGRGCLFRIRRPDYGRRSRMIQESDTKAHEVRRHRAPPISDSAGDLRGAVERGSEILYARLHDGNIPWEDRWQQL